MPTSPAFTPGQQRPVEHATAATGAARTFFLDERLTESMLIVTPGGEVLVGVTGATSEAGGGGALLRTQDSGETWEKVGPADLGDGAHPLNASMGGLTLDPVTGRLFVTSCGDPTCLVDNPWAEKIAGVTRRNRTMSDTLAFTDDGGASWKVVRGQFKDGGDWGKTWLGPAAKLESRARLAANGYPHVIYHSAGATFSETCYLWRSYDGGQTFERAPRPIFSSYIGKTPLPYGGAADPPEGAPRERDQHTLGGVGVVSREGTMLVPVNMCGFPRLYVSTDEGDTWTWRDIPVATARTKLTYDAITGFQDPPNAGRPFKPQQPFHRLYGSTSLSSLWSQQLAFDSEGVLYFAWVDAVDDLPYVATSRDSGETWSTPQALAAPGVDMAAVCALAVGGPGKVAVAYYGSRDGGWTFDGYVAITDDVLSAPSITHTQTRRERPIEPNCLSEPCEYVGVAFAPDGVVWASFAEDTGVIDDADPSPQCDGATDYNQARFRAVVLRTEDPT